MTGILAVTSCCPAICLGPSGANTCTAIPPPAPWYAEQARQTYELTASVPVNPGPEWHYHVTVAGCIFWEGRCVGGANGTGLCRGPLDPVTGECPTPFNMIDRSTMVAANFGELAALGRYGTDGSYGPYFLLGKDRKTEPPDGSSDELAPRLNPAPLTFTVNGAPRAGQAITYKVELATFRLTQAPEVIDTLAYFLGQIDRTAPFSLDGDPSLGHPLSLTVVGQRSYYVKWASTAFEVHQWDDQYIYLYEDHSGAPVPHAYSFSPGYWLKRRMAIGDQLVAQANLEQDYDASCGPSGPPRSNPYTMTLEAHERAMSLGGDLGNQDVIVVRYAYQSAAGDQIFEKFYYAKTYGWVKWELYDKCGTVTQTTLFNRLRAAPVQPGQPCRKG